MDLTEVRQFAKETFQARDEGRTQIVKTEGNGGQKKALPYDLMMEKTSLINLLPTLNSSIYSVQTLR